MDLQILSIARRARFLIIAVILVVSLLLLYTSNNLTTAQSQLSNVYKASAAWTGSRLAAVMAEEAVIDSSIPRLVAYNKIPETRLGPVGDQVVLLMASDRKGSQGRPIPDLHERAYENRREYADWHGYTLANYSFDDFTLEPGAHAIWKKVPAIKRAYDEHPEAEWIMWLDLDVILMSADLPLSTGILAPSVLEQKLLRNYAIPYTNRVTSSNMAAQDVNLIVAGDQNGLNAGVLLFRRSKFTELLLDLWMDPLLIEHNFKRREQDALVHLIDHHDHIFNHVGYVEQRAINAYGYDDATGWHEGDLLVHFAGCWTGWLGGICASQWEKYWSIRTLVPEDVLVRQRKFP